MVTLNEKLYKDQKRKPSVDLNSKVKSFDINTLTQRKDTLENALTMQFTMDEVVSHLNQNNTFNLDISQTRYIRTPSEKAIKDNRYRSSRIERV